MIRKKVPSQEVIMEALELIVSMLNNDKIKAMQQEINGLKYELAHYSDFFSKVKLEEKENK